MNFYRIIIVSVAFFSPFLCQCADITPQRSAPKKYHVKQISLIEKTEQDVLAISTPEEKIFFLKMFQPMKPFANETNAERIEPSITDLNNEVILKQNILNACIQENNDLKENNLELQKKHSELKEQIATKEQQPEQKKENQKRQEEIKQKIMQHKKLEADQKKLAKAKVASDRQKQPNPCTERKHHWYALKALMKQRCVRDLPSLVFNLQELSEDIHKGYEINNKTFGPYLNKNHILLGQINKHWSFVFCPCTKQISAVNQHYFHLTNIAKNLPGDFFCGPQCKRYGKKPKTSHIYDTDTSSDMNTTSDPETSRTRPESEESSELEPD